MQSARKMRKPKFQTVLPNGPRLKIIFADKGLDYSDVMLMTGIKERTIDKIMSGRHLVRLDTLKKIAVALNISLSEISLTNGFHETKQVLRDWYQYRFMFTPKWYFDAKIQGATPGELFEMVRKFVADVKEKEGNGPPTKQEIQLMFDMYEWEYFDKYLFV